MPAIASSSLERQLLLMVAERLWHFTLPLLQTGIQSRILACPKASLVNHCWLSFPAALPCPFTCFPMSSGCPFLDVWSDLGQWALPFLLQALAPHLFLQHHLASSLQGVPTVWGCPHQGAHWGW